MKERSMFKPVSISMPSSKQFRQPQAMNLGVANNVFKVLHGWHGNFFLAKFATGKLAGVGEFDAQGRSIEGQDEGIRNARKIWAHGLRTFDEATVETALAQCMERYKDSPPNLPQFVAICAANKPRTVYKPEVPALGMGQAIRSQYAAKAREVIARHAQKAAQNRLSVPEPMPAGLGGLMQAIASAVATAGGDEVAALIRLESMLAPKSVLELNDPCTSP